MVVVVVAVVVVVVVAQAVVLLALGLQQVGPQQRRQCVVARARLPQFVLGLGLRVRA